MSDSLPAPLRVQIFSQHTRQCSQVSLSDSLLRSPSPWTLTMPESRPAPRVSMGDSLLRPSSRFEVVASVVQGKFQWATHFSAPLRNGSRPPCSTNRSRSFNERLTSPLLFAASLTTYYQHLASSFIRDSLLRSSSPVATRLRCDRDGHAVSMSD